MTDTPTEANEVAVVTNDTRLIVSKRLVSKDATFDEAQELAAKHESASGLYVPFRCPTRKEAMDLYDARFKGLDEALKLIGSDPMNGYGWTCEADPDPECNSHYAFVYSSTSGNVYSYSKYNSYTVRPVSAF